MINGQWTVSNMRWDKKYPNPKNIIDQVTELIKFDWNEIYNYPETYYHKKCEKKKIILNNYLPLLIEKLKYSENESFIDFGCGFGKLNKYINTSMYVGIDKDPYCIFVASQKYNKHFVVKDLNVFSEENIPDIKYDNLIFMNNFGYHTDEWYKYIDHFSKKGSKMIINYLNVDKIKSIKYFGNSYIKNENDFFEFYFEWVHEKPMKEKKIKSLNLPKWKCIYELKPTGDKILSDYYVYKIYEKII